MYRRWSQTLLGSAQWQDKRQQAQARTQEIPTRYSEKVLYSEKGQALEECSKEAVESMSLEISKLGRTKP